MKRFYIFTVMFFIIGGVFFVNAQDIIVLKDGNMIEAKVIEISSTEIRYKRFNHLDGPTVVVSASSVLSIRYENGTVEVFNAAPAPVGQASPQANIPQPNPQANVPQQGNTAPQSSPQAQANVPQEETTTLRSSPPPALQNILNSLPAIPIAGNNLKFVFAGESWTAMVNRENFSAGTLVFEGTEEGGILTLTQTHIWPGAVGKAVGKTAGKIASLIPGGGTVGSVLDTAGNIAGAFGGPVEASGTIVLEYKAGPRASLKLVSNSGDSSSKPNENQRIGVTERGRSSGDSSSRPNENTGNKQPKSRTNSGDSSSKPNENESGKAEGSSSASVKFSFGEVIGIYTNEGTSTSDYNNRYVYTHSWSATYLTLLEPILSLRLLSSFENRLQLGLGFDLSVSVVNIIMSGKMGFEMSGMLPLYGIIGYNNTYLHVGYDFIFGALYLAPSFTITEHFMINIPMSLFYSYYGMFKIGIAFQYVF